MASTQKLRLVYPGDWAPPAPISDEALAKNILSDPLDDEPFGLGFAWQAQNLCLEIKQRFGRERKGEAVEAIYGGAPRRIVCSTNLCESAV